MLVPGMLVTYDVSHGVGGELGGVLRVEHLLPPSRPSCGEVHDISPGLTLLQVVDARDGEGPGLAGTLGDPADHGVGGLAGVASQKSKLEAPSFTLLYNTRIVS